MKLELNCREIAPGRWDASGLTEIRPDFANGLIWCGVAASLMAVAASALPDWWSPLFEISGEGMPIGTLLRVGGAFTDGAKRPVTRVSDWVACLDLLSPEGQVFRLGIATMKGVATYDLVAAIVGTSNWPGIPIRAGLRVRPASTGTVWSKGELTWVRAARKTVGPDGDGVHFFLPGRKPTTMILEHHL